MFREGIVQVRAVTDRLSFAVGTSIDLINVAKPLQVVYKDMILHQLKEVIYMSFFQ